MVLRSQQLEVDLYINRHWADWALAGKAEKVAELLKKSHQLEVDLC
jgi:hypothetical protein